MIVGLIAEAAAAGAPRREACALLGLAPSTLQRWKKDPRADRRGGPRPRTANQLTRREAKRLLRTLNSPAFCDLPPKVVVALLADQGVYLGSESTMYRLLRQAGQLAHRRSAKPPTRRAKPREARATAPNQVWCWDITYLPSAVRGVFHKLYLVLDVFSRKVVGTAVHASELARHAADLLDRTYAAEGVQADELVLHADNGGPMKGSSMLSTMRRLGVVASFSRPRVSNDNAFAESVFNTLKGCPAYPKGGVFATLEDARQWVAKFVHWYNTEHRHSGIKFVTPHQRHTGEDVAILRSRAAVYAAAQRRRPDRWTGPVRNWTRVTEVRLNPDATPNSATAPASTVNTSRPQLP